MDTILQPLVPQNGELLTGRGGRQLCSLVTAVSAYLEASATERRRGVAVSCQWVHYCPSLTHPPPDPPLPLSQTRTTRFST